MQIKVNGEIHTVVELDLEAKQFLSGYVCEDGKTYPAGECTVVKEAVQEPFKRAWEPEPGEQYSFVDSRGKVDRSTHDNMSTDLDRIADGNTYETRIIADAEAKYFSALRRIRNVIRENGQEPEKLSECVGVLHYNDEFITQYGKYSMVCGLRIIDKDFAAWLIKEYSADLKILAGVE